MFRTEQKEQCLQMEEVLSKWKQPWNRLLKENAGSGTKPYTQKIGRIRSVSRYFKPFIAPTALFILRKMSRPGNSFF